MRKLIGAILAAACLVAAGPSAADPVKGDIVRSSFDIGQVRVAVPPGDWQVMTVHTGKAISSDGIPNGSDYKGLYLIQVDQNKNFVGSFYARATLTTGKPLEWRDKLCQREDTLFRVVLGGPAHSQDCVLGNHLVRFFEARPRDPVERDAWNWIQANGVKVPKTVIEVQEHFFRGSDYLWVAYTVNPELVDFVPSTVTGWRESEWHPDFVKTDPERKEYVEHLKAWALANAKVHQAALRDNAKKGEIAPYPR